MPNTCNRSSLRARSSRAALLVALVAWAGVACSAFAQAAPEPTDKPLSEPTPSEQPAAPVAEPRIKSPVAAKPAELIVEQEAVDVLTKCAEAVKTLKSLTMKANTGSTGGGMFERMAQKIEGKVIAARSPSNPSDWVVRATGSGTPRANEASLEFDCIWTGGEAQWVDHKDKKVLKRTVGGARGVAYQLPMQIRPAGLFAAEPLSAQLASKEIKMEKAADAGGTPCDVVLVSVDGKRDRTRWYIAKSDHLPRKVEKVIESPMGSGSSYVEFGDLQIDKDVPAAALQMVTPEGYSADENTAPATKAEKRAAAGEGPKVVSLKPSKPDGAASAEEHGEASNVDAANAAQSGNAAAPAPGGPVAELAPAFDLPDMEGKSVSLESLKGRVVVLNFWGTWSPKGKASHAELQTLSGKYKDKNVAVLAAAVREKGKDAITQHMTSHNYTFRVLQDGDKITKAYKVSTFPTTVVIDGAGHLVGTFTGFTKDDTFKKVEEAIEKALQAK